MSAFRKILVLAAIALLAAVSRGADDNPALRVVLLANRADPDSLRIARHYAEVRGVPPENIIALNLPLTEAITWREFITTLWEPLLDELMRAKWVDAIPMALTDPVGRRKLAVYSHRLAALVVCRGVPLKIDHDPALLTESPFSQKPEFRTNQGAVDSELSLLAHPNYPINAFVPNPLFQKETLSTLEAQQIVKVARLDGPTVESALGLVDLAVAAERSGLLGRAYVDRGGPHASGDQWLDSVAEQLTRAGFAPVVDREPLTMPATARCDAPVLYFGWYSGNMDGPFALPGFRFPPGAIAVHIHSFTAATLRSATAGWSGPLVARGVTATVGNVFEPYLELTHRPNLFVRALLKGATLVDAAYFALPELSWHAILIGDPLYRPFAVPLETQLKSPATLPPRLAGYAALRRVNELVAANRRDEALALARSAQRDTPCLALGVALSGLLRDAGDPDGAANALGFITLFKNFAADEWALAREAAVQLETLGRPGRAAELWRALLAVEALPRELRVVWLRDASRAALAARDLTQAGAWDRALIDLTPLPAEKK
ncbi:MAG: TIGR03790 family protein [Verrucomicrobia bacterium]|nr:TIGR03790 family protein [Verrucomicrobiota bacterium]